MIWAVLIVGIGLVILVQVFSAEKSLQVLAADRQADAVLTEPDAEVSVQVSLRNNSHRLIPFVKAHCSLPFTKETCVSFSAWLGPRQVLVHQFGVTASRRGRYVLEKLHVSCGDFLGLKEQEKVCGSFREIVVAPKSLPLPRLETVMGGFLGDVSARRFILEDPVLTLGYREYTGTEPMKRISWAQTARHNALMVRKNDYTIDPSVSVLLNVQSDLENREEVLETCFSTARAVCEVLEAKGIHYSFTTNAQLLGCRYTDTGINGLGQRHFSAILEILGRSSAKHRFSLGRLVETELQRPGCSGRILITPGGCEAHDPRLNRLGESGTLLVLKGTEAALWQ